MFFGLSSWFLPVCTHYLTQFSSNNGSLRYVANWLDFQDNLASKNQSELTIPPKLNSNIIAQLQYRCDHSQIAATAANEYLGHKISYHNFLQAENAKAQQIEQHPTNSNLELNNYVEQAAQLALFDYQTMTNKQDLYYVVKYGIIDSLSLFAMHLPLNFFASLATAPCYNIISFTIVTMGALFLATYPLHWYQNYQLNQLQLNHDYYLQAIDAYNIDKEPDFPWLGNQEHLDEVLPPTVSDLLGMRKDEAYFENPTIFNEQDLARITFLAQDISYHPY